MQPGNACALAKIPTLYPGSDGDHFTNHLMSERQRKLWRLDVALDYVQIGTANTTSQHLEQKLTISWEQFIMFLKPQRVGFNGT